jgi:hypothetical protein
MESEFSMIHALLNSATSWEPSQSMSFWGTYHIQTITDVEGIRLSLQYVKKENPNSAKPV